MPRRPLLACALTAALLAGLVHGQQQDEPEGQPTPFRTGTNVVRVDVTVMDKDGSPVRSLTADDFEVRENGQVQAITSFKLVNATGEPTDDFSLPIRSREHAAAEAARDDVRVFVVFWDEYHIDQFGSAVRAREQLSRFVLNAFGPTDLVAITDQLTPVDALRFTRDRRVLADHVHLLKGRRGVYVPTRSAIEEAHLRGGQDVERIRSQVTFTALKSVIMHLGAIRQGRKAVVFVSEGFGRLGQDGVRVLSDLVRTANDNNTAVYTVDPRGLQAGPSGFGMGMSPLLAALSDATGAEPIVSNDISGALRRVVQTSSAFYLLGYSPTESQLDGKFREIKVRVKRGGVEVRARNGYWAPRSSDVERARALALAAALPSPVSKAFRELTPDNSRRAADFWIGLSASSEEPLVSVAWTPRPGIEGRAAAAGVSVSATADGQVLFDGQVAERGVTFEAPPGEVELEFTTLDSAGEVIGREQRSLAVPSPEATTLALSTPIVSRARSAAEFRELSAQAAPNIFAGREFQRTDRLLVRVRPFGSDAEGAAVTAELLGPRGATLAELPVRPAANGEEYQIDLPLTNLAAGEFLIAIAARTETGRVEALVPLRVGR